MRVVLDRFSPPNASDEMLDCEGCGRRVRYDQCEDETNFCKECAACWCEEDVKAMNAERSAMSEACCKHGQPEDAPCDECAAKLLPTTCEECDRLGWPTKQPLHGIEGHTLCWTHAQLAFLQNDQAER